MTLLTLAVIVWVGGIIAGALMEPHMPDALRRLDDTDEGGGIS